jgi:hypothetical protein
MSDTSVEAKNFKFLSPNSKLTFNAKAKYESLETLSDTYPDAFVTLDVQKSVIGLQDVHFFSPTLLDGLPLHIDPNTTVRIDTKIEGYLKNLLIHHFTAQTLSETYINTQGNIDIRKGEDPYLNLTVDKFYTTQTDVESIVPDTLIPTSIAIPEWLNISGDFDGTFNSPTVKTIVTSNLGLIQLDAQLERNKSTGKSNYSGTLSLKDFHTGKLLKKEERMGPITLIATVDGSGFKMDELNSRVSLNIASFIYQGYNYRNFTLAGSIKKYFFEGTARLLDENLNLKLDGDLDYNEEVPKYRFTFELKNADFKALHLSERPLRARGTLDVDLATSDFKVINGNLDIRKVAIYNGKDMYAVDSLLFASIDQEGQSEISIRSDIVDGNFEGTFNLLGLPEVIRRHFNNYFSLHDTAYSKPTQPQNFRFNLKIKNTDLLTEILVPVNPVCPNVPSGGNLTATMIKLI